MHGVPCAPRRIYPFAGSREHASLTFIFTLDAWEFVDPLLDVVGDPHHCELPDDPELDWLDEPSRVLMYEV